MAVPARPPAIEISAVLIAAHPKGAEKNNTPAAEAATRNKNWAILQMAASKFEVEHSGAGSIVMVVVGGGAQEAGDRMFILDV